MTKYSYELMYDERGRGAWLYFLDSEENEVFKARAFVDSPAAGVIDSEVDALIAASEVGGWAKRIVLRRVLRKGRKRLRRDAKVEAKKARQIMREHGI